MDAYSSNSDYLPYSSRPPFLVAGTGDAALSRAIRPIEASDARIAGTVDIAGAEDRIERQASRATIWAELDGECTARMGELLTQIGRYAEDGRHDAVVSVSRNLLDVAAARLLDAPVEILVEPNEAERLAALALVGSGTVKASRASDVAADRNAERLRQLSDEVSRIASTLARLSTGPTAPSPSVFKPAPADAPPVSADLVRSIIRARRLRGRFFQEDLFADPAWDMLLDLFQAEIAQLRVPVSSLCIAAAVPATTALRWLKTMVQQGLFLRREDPHDGRRVFVELAPKASEALRSYFAEVGRVAPV